MNIYKDQIIGYAQNPPNHGVIENADYVVEADNPACGDTLTIYLKTENNIIKDAKFTGDGCAISKAAASMLLEKAIGKKINRFGRREVLELLGIPISPAREKCAFLVLQALDNIE